MALVTYGLTAKDRDELQHPVLDSSMGQPLNQHNYLILYEICIQDVRNTPMWPTVIFA